MRLGSWPSHFAVTVKVVGETAAPAGVITTTEAGPNPTSAGTVVRTSVALDRENVALTSPKSTSVAPPRLVPRSTTWVPTGPEAGEIEVMMGTLSVSGAGAGAGLGGSGAGAGLGGAGAGGFGVGAGDGAGVGAGTWAAARAEDWAKGAVSPAPARTRRAEKRTVGKAMGHLDGRAYSLPWVTADPIRHPSHGF